MPATQRMTMDELAAGRDRALGLTWIFQVIPLFMVAGFAVGIPSWRRYGERGGTAGSWVARRVWRLQWPWSASSCRRWPSMSWPRAWDTCRPPSRRGVWVNFVLWWVPIGLAGRWWPYSHERRARRIGAGVAGGALVLLVLVTATGWYPVAMIGVTGQARSNALPPTLALALLAAAQIGVLFAAAEPLRRRLAARDGICRWPLPARGR